MRDNIIEAYERLIFESDEDSILDTLEQFKNNLSKLKWQFEGQQDITSFEDFIKSKIGNTDLINVLKNINSSLNNNTNNINNINKDDKQVNVLITFRKVLKLCDNEDDRYQKYLNQLDNNIKNVLIGIKIQNATYLQVLSYCFKRYNLLNNKKNLEQAWEMVSNLAKGKVENLAWPQNEFQNKLFRMIPPKGLLTENDTNVGNGEMYLIMKYGLTSADKASHMDLQTVNRGKDKEEYYEVKNITPEGDKLSKAYVYCGAEHEKNGKSTGLSLKHLDRSFVLALNNSDNTLTKISCAQIESLMANYYLVDFSQQNWNQIHNNNPNRTAKTRKYWVHESLLGLDSKERENSLSNLEKENIKDDPMLQSIKKERNNNINNYILNYAERSHGGVDVYGLMKALGIVTDKPKTDKVKKKIKRKFK